MSMFHICQASRDGSHFLTVLSLVSASDDKLTLKTNRKPFPGLKRGSKIDVIPKNKTGLIESRIVNGNFAAKEQLPYQVGLLIGFPSNKYSWCGGTLIGNEWIITAAHCTTGAISIQVRLGSTDSQRPLRISWGYQNHIHPNWGKKNGDIALVKIQWVDYNVNMAPAALPPLNVPHSDYVNVKAVVSGWGGINDNGNQQLKYVAMPVMAGEDCAKVYGANAKEPEIMCTKNQGYGGICGGDSGGPLVVENTRLLIGVSAFGAGSGCTKGLPSGFSRVTYYLKWIKDVSGISW